MEVTQVRKICRNIGMIMLALLLVIGLLPDQAYARTFVDLDKKAELSVEFVPDNILAADTEFRLYRVADITKFGEYELTDNFDDYDIVIENMDEDAWNALVAKLEGYISAGQIAPEYTEKTDENGVAEFTDIDLGLYMVTGDTFYANSYYYMPQAFVISLPTAGMDENGNDQWLYEVEASPKYEKIPELISLEILKVWKDNDYSGRPSSVEIEVYEGNELYETVTLSEDNNWRCELTDLFGGSNWSVKEKNVPEGYRVSVEKQSGRFVINNSRPTEDIKDVLLPQTGVLWWPVPVLVAVGLLFIALGYIRRNRGN